MPLLLAALALVICITSPKAASAQDQTLPPATNKIAATSASSQLAGLLQKLGFDVIAPARAAECASEGETCTSNEQCCSGLECAGGPPATCIPED